MEVGEGFPRGNNVVFMLSRSYPEEYNLGVCQVYILEDIQHVNISILKSILKLLKNCKQFSITEK